MNEFFARKDRHSARNFPENTGENYAAIAPTTGTCFLRFERYELPAVPFMIVINFQQDLNRLLGEWFDQIQLTEIRQRFSDERILNSCMDITDILSSFRILSTLSTR